MKRFKFSLERMKDYKESVLDKEKDTLGRLRAERNQMEETIRQLKEESARIAHELSDRTLTGITAAEIRGYRFQIENIALQVEQKERELRFQEMRIERQVQVVVGASREVAGLDKLEERQREEYRVMVAKDEEQVISEFVSQKLVREKAVSGSHPV